MRRSLLCHLARRVVVLQSQCGWRRRGHRLPRSSQAMGQWSAPWRCGTLLGDLAESDDCLLLRSGSLYSPHCVLSWPPDASTCVLGAVWRYLPYKGLTLAITVVRITDNRPLLTYYTMDGSMSRMTLKSRCTFFMSGFTDERSVQISTHLHRSERVLDSGDRFCYDACRENTVVFTCTMCIGGRSCAIRGK